MSQPPDNRRSTGASGRKRAKRSRVALSLVAFDLETTGFDAESDRITEIGAVKFSLDGLVIDSYQALVNPGKKIPKEVQEKTGITNDIVKSAPTAWESIQRFAAWVGEHPILIAHNAPFEAKFIQALYSRQKREPPNWLMLDTLEWARRKRFPVENNRLETLLEHIGSDTEGLHRALPDARGVMSLALHLAATVKDSKGAVKRRARKIADMAWVPPSAKQLYYLKRLGASEAETTDVDRDKASALIDEYKSKAKSSRRRSYSGDRPATYRQLSYLRRLGADEDELDDLTVEEASELIEDYKDGGGGSSSSGCGCVVIALIVLFILALVFL